MIKSKDSLQMIHKDKTPRVCREAPASTFLLKAREPGPLQPDLLPSYASVHYTGKRKVRVILTIVPILPGDCTRLGVVTILTQPLSRI